MTVEALAGGRYRVERTLGHGGMAVVYLAADEDLGRSVAIKVLADSLAGEPELRERFVREARLAARLSHPNVVQVYNAGNDGGRPYIVMEHVAGETVADLLRRRRPLPPAEVVELALQACEGLQHAHDAGLVHRDVKPQNLLLREDGTLKIADFGIARAAESTRLTQVGTVLGTAAYLAPEQAAGEDVTAAADLYSLGAVLYELLTGRPPYTFESIAELAAKQSGGVIAPVRDLEPDLSPALEAVVMRCLARDPRFRPESAAALAHQLRGASADAPTIPLAGPAPTAVTMPLPPRATSSVPGSGAWLWIAAAAILGLVALVFGVGGLGRGGDGSSPRRPAPVRPIPNGATPQDEARNLSAWLREHSR